MGQPVGEPVGQPTWPTAPAADATRPATVGMNTKPSRYAAEPVEVRRGDDAPEQFCWRGRLYLVQAVLGHWCEVAPWWLEHAPRPGPAGVVETERELWRVEAAAGRMAGSGVYDLCLDWDTGRWSLARVLD